MRFSSTTAIVSLALSTTAGALAQDEDEQVADRAYVVLTTNKGDIALELNREKAPITVDNFLQYVSDGHYDGTIFHRVMPTFMIQGGGFDADLVKKPTRDPIANEWQNGLKNDRGTISMARLGGDPDSATCQFFINVVDNARLDAPQPDGAAYAVFGKVIGSIDAVEWIRKTPTRAQGQHRHMPTETLIIESAEQVTEGDRISALLAGAEDWNSMDEMARSDQFSAAMKQLELRGFDVSQGVETESGLWYLDVEVGDGPSPSGPSDTVRAHYTGWLPNGEIFDSSKTRGNPIAFGLNRVIGGWTEGVGSMKVGGTRYLIIPPELGYGARGAPGAVPPNSHLIFEVELVGLGQ